MKKNIAVVGCGHWGKNLVRNFAELKSLSSVCDPNTKLAQRYADDYEVDNLSFTEILKSQTIEGVVLAVPAPLHADMAIEAMNAGKHIFVEKPLAMNCKEAERMIICAEKNNVKLMVGHLLQYHPVFSALKEIVQSGKLGSIRYIYSNRLSYGKLRTEEDVIWSFAPHDISMILSLTDIEPTIVKRESSNILQSNISDIATIHMSFNANLNAHVSVSWLHPYKEQKLVVIGEESMLVFDDTKAWIEKLAHYSHTVTYKGNIPNLNKADVDFIKVPESEPLRNECKHFMDVVNTDIEPLTGGKEGLDVLKVLTAASF